MHCDSNGNTRLHVVIKLLIPYEGNGFAYVARCNLLQQIRIQKFDIP